MTNQPKTQRRPAGGPMMGGPMGGMNIGAKPKNFGQGLRQLVAYLRPYLLVICVSIVFSGAATVLAILAPGLVGDIVDAFGLSVMTQSPVDMQLVGSIGLCLAIYYVMSLALNYTQAWLMALVNTRVSLRLRRDISRKINVVPLRYFDNASIGDTLSRVTNDVDTIGQSLNQSVSMLFSSVIMLVGVVIAMLVTCWQLALTAILTVPLSMLILMLVVKASHKYFVAQQSALGQLNGTIEENYSAQTIVKAFNAEQRVAHDFGQTNHSLYRSAVLAQFLSGLMMPVMHLVANIGLAAVCVVGGLLIIHGYILEVGILSAFFMYIRLFQNPINQIAQAVSSLQSTVAAGERVFDFLATEEQADESTKPAYAQPVRGNVEFRNVHFGYEPGRPIINDFCAQIRAGQKVAIIGPTGAGKTTLINLLMRFYELDSGDILIDGVPISDMRRQDVRAMFGMVLQDTWLFEGTIRQNIVYATQNVTESDVIRAAVDANVDHYIRTLPDGYDMHLDNDVSISSGQRQLLTIARAMVQNSPMIILDEATSNVDTRTEQMIQDAMDRVTQGRTSFVIAHRLSTIRNADLILVLDHGDIVESGTHDQLLAAGGLYRQLYNAQFAADQVVAVPD